LQHYFFEALARGSFLAASLPLQVCEHAVINAASAVQESSGGRVSAGTAFALVCVAPSTGLSWFALILNAPYFSSRHSQDESGSKCSGGGGGLRAAVAAASAVLAAGVLLSFAVDALPPDTLPFLRSPAKAGGGHASHDSSSSSSSSNSSLELLLLLPPWFENVSVPALAFLGAAAVFRRLWGKGQVFATKKSKAE
jgi:hypothetical protein